MKKHFTLTEILVVVFLIGVLTAIGFGMYSYAMNSAKESGTRALLTRLEAALETCNTKFGYIPVSKESREFNEIRFKIDSDGMIINMTFAKEALPDNTPPSTEEQKKFQKEFLRTIDAENLKKNLQKDGSNDYYVLIDGWGNKIYYAYPGRFNKTGYDLYSAGSDNRLGKDADSVSAENLNKAKQETFKDTATNEMLCDDICNF